MRSRRRNRMPPLVRRLGSEDPPSARRDGVEKLKVLWTAACMLRDCWAERAEPLHFVLSSSHRRMRVFGAIVLSQPLLVREGQPQTPERRGVGAQLDRRMSSRLDPLHPDDTWSDWRLAIG